MNMDVYSGWTKQIWRKEDAHLAIIKLQKMMIVLLFVIVIGLILGWMRAPSKLTVYLPPDLSNGATVKPGEIPKAMIYSFAYQVWQELNAWTQNGKEDYKNNIETYWSYLTPQFKKSLLEDYEILSKTGQIDRIRFIQGVSGRAYDETSVKKLSSDTWEVNLKVLIVEYKNQQVVKHVEILYPLKITRTEISERNNPFGLVMAGFTRSPLRLNTV